MAWLSSRSCAGFQNPLEVDFDDKQGKYSVAIHFAPQFHALRHGICGDDLNFVRSLHKCSQINVSGGKTRAAFFLSHDQRFLLKVHRVDRVWFSAKSKTCFLEGL